MPRSAYSDTIQLTRGQLVMLDDVLAGLDGSPKTLPSKYFYDEEGSRIFDEITRLPEYYPTRTESLIMQSYGEEITGALGQNVLLVEYGSGNSSKTRILLDRLPGIAGYVPVDISGEYLESVAAEISSDYPGLPVHPVVADFTQPFTLPEIEFDRFRTIAYFPGSTIGNFVPGDASRILARLADLAGRDGGVLIGVDLRKSEDILLPAYNDSRGVTARFNLNMLRRMNSELRTDFDLDQFQHLAVFNSEESRIEMRLLSKKAQHVCIGDRLINFEPGEPILTEYSHKYTAESFAALAANSGLSVKRVWTDPGHLFSVQYLVPGD